MKQDKRVYISIFWIVLGAVLAIWQFAGNTDEYWSGLGIALLVVGVLQLARRIKYHRNAQYRENIDTQNNDERNRFLSARAWAWAGYLYMLVGCIAIIVLQIAGLREISQTISFTVCALLIFYWVSYMFLHRKY
ncbi:MAG: hypothetical protein IJN69_08240 [Oscillospiraceae bacterium]|nr:hypothetical protein [Oscillospiraceae bacterium]